MTAPLGVRVCPVLGCSRRIHVTAAGTVWARCLSHSLALLGAAFSSQPVTPDPSVERFASLPPGRTTRQSDRTSLAVGTRTD